MSIAYTTKDGVTHKLPTDDPNEALEMSNALDSSYATDATTTTPQDHQEPLTAPSVKDRMAASYASMYGKGVVPTAADSARLKMAYALVPHSAYLQSTTPGAQGYSATPSNQLGVVKAAAQDVLGFPGRLLTSTGSYIANKGQVPFADLMTRTEEPDSYLGNYIRDPSLPLSVAGSVLAGGIGAEIAPVTEGMLTGLNKNLLTRALASGARAIPNAALQAGNAIGSQAAVSENGIRTPGEAIATGLGAAIPVGFGNAVGGLAKEDLIQNAQKVFPNPAGLDSRTAAQWLVKTAPASTVSGEMSRLNKTINDSWNKFKNQYNPNLNFSNTEPSLQGKLGVTSPEKAADAIPFMKEFTKKYYDPSITSNTLTSEQVAQKKAAYDDLTANVGRSIDNGDMSVSKVDALAANYRRSLPEFQQYIDEKRMNTINAAGRKAMDPKFAVLGGEGSTNPSDIAAGDLSTNIYLQKALSGKTPTPSFIPDISGQYPTNRQFSYYPYSVFGDPTVRTPVRSGLVGAVTPVRNIFPNTPDSTKGR